jgi:hypothetical protein
VPTTLGLALSQGTASRRPSRRVAFFSLAKRMRNDRPRLSLMSRSERLAGVCDGGRDHARVCSNSTARRIRRRASVSTRSGGPPSALLLVNPLQIAADVSATNATVAPVAAVVCNDPRTRPRLALAHAPAPQTAAPARADHHGAQGATEPVLRQRERQRARQTLSRLAWPSKKRHSCTFRGLR